MKSPISNLPNPPRQDYENHTEHVALHVTFQLRSIKGGQQGGSAVTTLTL